jgi:hypothetical protein
VTGLWATLIDFASKSAILAVQEERHRFRMDKAIEHEPESTSNYTTDMPPERIFESELSSEASLDSLKVFHITFYYTYFNYLLRFCYAFLVRPW